jgi:sorbitol/mannitol transport system permease protein
MSGLLDRERSSLGPPARPPVAPVPPTVARRTRWARRAPLLPAVVFIVLVTQAPAVLTVYYSFQRWVLLRPAERGFAGLDNYRYVLGDPDFRAAVTHTVVITSLAVVLSVLLGLVLALLLDRRFRGRGVARTLLITPFLVMPAASALVWKTSILDANFGVLNWLLGLVGVEGVEWVAEHPTAVVVAFLTWQWTPFTMLILLAGLQSQPVDVVEAARVDGADATRIFRHLTWPHLRRYLELATILGTVYVVQAFDPVYLITQGGPGNATTNLPYYLYQETFRAGNIGRASAAGVLVVVASIVVCTVALRLVSTVFREEES